MAEGYDSNSGNIDAPEDAPADAREGAWPLQARPGPPQRQPRDELSLAPMTASAPAPSNRAKKVSPWVRPLMWAYRLVSRDSAQSREWSDRLEAIDQASAIDAESSTEGKALLSDLQTYRQMKSTGFVGAMGGMTLGALWMSWLIPAYAYGWGFGWWAYAYLIPVPFVWRWGRRLWERAALQGMKELGPNPTQQQQLRTLSSGMLRGMGAGAGMGFSLIFLQGLISWFMTPAPTLGAELVLDLLYGIWGAGVGATLGAVFGPLVGRAAPRVSAPPPAALLAASDTD